MPTKLETITPPFEHVTDWALLDRKDRTSSLVAFCFVYYVAFHPEIRLPGVLKVSRAECNGRSLRFIQSD